MRAAMFDAAPFNLILHPKSNGNGREWPLERYAELADRLFLSVKTVDHHVAASRERAALLVTGFGDGAEPL